MRLLATATLLLALTASALAQQPPDPKFMQHAIEALTAQRNNALDGQAALAARLAIANDDLAKMNAKVAEMEKQVASAKPEAPK